MNYLTQAKQLLTEQKLTCAILGPGTCYTSTQRGIMPLLTCYRSGSIAPNCSAADKVVGRAAAFLYLLLGVRELYAEVISRPAQKVLLDAGVYVQCDQLVDAIINRTGTGFCPMESAVMQINDPLEALAAVERTLDQLRN